MGARRIAILNAAPLGFLPLVETLGGMQSANQNMNEATELFNAKLSSHLHSLNYQLPNASIVYVDFYKPFYNLFQNPNKYGDMSFIYLILIFFSFFFFSINNGS